jgi:hypothetical protein
MWDNPDALNRLTRLILAATLLFTLWIAGRAALEAWFPFRQITVSAPSMRRPGRRCGPWRPG